LTSIGFPNYAGFSAKGRIQSAERAVPGWIKRDHPLLSALRCLRFTIAFWRKRQQLQWQQRRHQQRGSGKNFSIETRCSILEAVFFVLREKRPEIDYGRFSCQETP
jgi:hypothetical protein